MVPRQRWATAQRRYLWLVLSAHSAAPCKCRWLCSRMWLSRTRPAAAAARRRRGGLPGYAYIYRYMSNPGDVHTYVDTQLSGICGVKGIARRRRGWLYTYGYIYRYMSNPETYTYMWIHPNTVDVWSNGAARVEQTDCYMHTYTHTWVNLSTHTYTYVDTPK